MFACIYFQIKYHAMHVFLILLFLSKKGLLMCIRLVFVCYLSALLQKWTLRFDRLMAWNSNSKYLPHYHKMAIKVFAANTLIKMLTLISYIFFLNWQLRSIVYCVPVGPDRNILITWSFTPAFNLSFTHQSHWPIGTVSLNTSI